jgi:hypothetical protein
MRHFRLLLSVVVWYFDTHVRSPRAKILSGSKKREGKYRERASRSCFYGARRRRQAASTPSQEKILAADSSEESEARESADIRRAEPIIVDCSLS